jgi:transcriptional regulator with XRE-family HTH domain
MVYIVNTSLAFSTIWCIIPNMVSQNQASRRNYTKLGKVLKDARKRLRDEHTGKIPRVEDVAEQLTVTKGFVYQVEQGKRKPKDSTLGRWASVYGVSPLTLWKCLGRIPMDFITALREEPMPVKADPFSELTEDEKAELSIFLDFVRWKLAPQSSQAHAKSVKNLDI